MLESKSSILFTLTLGLSFALVVWWMWFLVAASAELSIAGADLARGDVHAAAEALGAGRPEDLAALGERRRIMFLSEGIFFASVLLLLGWLYFASVRREASLRATQDRFLAGATHELKTPLATIVLLLESLRDDRVPAEKRQRYLANGLLEAERLERGLGNVLTAAGLRTTRAVPAPQPGDLVEDVHAAVAAMQARALAAGVTIEAVAAGVIPWARDAAAVQMVLRNLLDNAIKYAPGSVVQINLDRTTTEARIDVIDRGRGMDQEELQHLFEPFWSNDHVSGGTGLGLHLVRELVRVHGGTVSAASDGRGRGARFTIRLPLGSQS